MPFGSGGDFSEMLGLFILSSLSFSFSKPCLSASFLRHSNPPSHWTKEKDKEEKSAVVPMNRNFCRRRGYGRHDGGQEKMEAGLTEEFLVDCTEGFGDVGGVLLGVLPADR